MLLIINHPVATEVNQTKANRSKIDKCVIALLVLYYSQHKTIISKTANYATHCLCAVSTKTFCIPLFTMKGHELMASPVAHKHCSASVLGLATMESANRTGKF